jgi:hypothetical protein
MEDLGGAWHFGSPLTTPQIWRRRGAALLAVLIVSREERGILMPILRFSPS